MNQQKLTINDFTGGLNTKDNSIDIKPNQLVIADNVKFDPIGSAISIDGFLQIGNDIQVNGVDATNILGAVSFNNTVYILASNGTVARLLYYDSPDWVEVDSQNFDKDAKATMIVYKHNIWMVNGLETSSNVLHYINTSNVLSGITTASGLEVGLKYMVLHNERIWISKGNTLFATVMYPQANADDWDATTVYTGADTAGVIPIDNNTEDEIVGLVVNYAQLCIMRKYSLFLLTGAIITQSQMTKRTNTRTGVKAPLSIAKADKVIYFYSDEGIKTFTGVTVQEGSTNFDTISTVTIDENIEDEINDIADVTALIGYAFRDKYYLSDGVDYVFVFDERTGGWSRWTISGIELFLESGKHLYGLKGNKYYQLDADTDASVLSRIKTKDFDCDNAFNLKEFHRLLFTFKRLSSYFECTLRWYMDGATDPTNERVLNIGSSAVKWDSGYFWNQQGIRWDMGIINFFRELQRKLKTGSTIAFEVEATGTNRFSINRLELIYEVMKKEVF